MGQHGEETAMWIGWDSLEENGTIIIDDEEKIWLLQVMAISEVDSGRREDCFGFKKNLVPCLWESCSFPYMVSNFSDDWSKMKKMGRGLQKLGPKVWRHSKVFPRKVCLTLEVSLVM